jgi:hypothetical protein
MLSQGFIQASEGALPVPHPGIKDGDLIPGDVGPTRMLQVAGPQGVGFRSVSSPCVNVGKRRHSFGDETPTTANLFLDHRR